MTTDPITKLAEAKRLLEEIECDLQTIRRDHMQIHYATGKVGAAIGFITMAENHLNYMAKEQADERPTE